MAQAVQVSTTASAVLAATNAQWEEVKPRTAVSMIAATAVQVSPADTRIEIVEAAG